MNLAISYDIFTSSGQIEELVFKMTAAFLLSLPIAWNRERHSRIMGVRTFPLVAVGTCAFTLTGLEFIGSDAVDAKARVLQGVLQGIGFVGGGAILKDNDRVKGTAAAASIWTTGAIGVASAYGFWTIAIYVSAFTFCVLAFMSRIKKDSDMKELDE